MSKRLPAGATLLGLLGLVAAVVIVTPQVSPIEHTAEQLPDIVRLIRIPTLILAMTAGVGLALAGMTFQAVFRNPLATPFTLGVSSGASLALCIAIACGMGDAWLGGTAQSLVAFAGALVVIAVVYGVGRWGRAASTTTLLLAGVCINFICGAGIILVQYLVSERESKAVIFWLMGRVEAVATHDYELWGTLVSIHRPTAIMAAVLVLGIAALTWIHRDLDLLMMGEDVAASRGVDVRRAHALAYFFASLMTAAVVAVCGPIAFVGLLVPHVMRSLVGPRHAVLLPACALFGAALLPACDCIARNLMAWTTTTDFTPLPVGVVTNVLGGLFFLVILVRRGDRPQ